MLVTESVPPSIAIPPPTPIPVKEPGDGAAAADGLVAVEAAVGQGQGPSRRSRMPPPIPASSMPVVPAAPLPPMARLSVRGAVVRFTVVPAVIHQDRATQALAPAVTESSR